MAERTGTLWENVDVSASCNHGFASHVIYWLNGIYGKKR
jgi:alpha-L-rhamnosidase